MTRTVAVTEITLRFLPIYLEYIYLY
eukprot:COSAG01_NODE_41392_length_452_cov_0.685552_1_plen_25_part_10